jgi:ATP-dependent DNA helicase RecQ
MDRFNIVYSVVSTLSPLQTLVRLVREKPKPLIVFDQSREGVARLCEILRERTTVESRFYHAGLEKDEKKETEAWFFASENGVLVSTCAYGLGVDKKNIRTTVHYRPPPSVEAYLQESGRGGQDGKISEAVLIRFDGGRAIFRKADSENDGKPEADSDAMAIKDRDARKILFLAYGSDRRCRRQSLLELMGSSLESPCSGCDICEGKAPEWPEGFMELVMFFHANPGKFDLSVSTRLLGGISLFAEKIDLDNATIVEGIDHPNGIEFDQNIVLSDSSSSGEPPECAFSGILSTWNSRDITKLIEEALLSGILKKGNTLRGKEKIYLDRRIKVEFVSKRFYF